ncbi:hypothetical protein KCU62_g161, partial [Aureobasidium sp. EXF-3399]
MWDPLAAQQKLAVPTTVWCTVKAPKVVVVVRCILVCSSHAGENIQINPGVSKELESGKIQACQSRLLMLVQGDVDHGTGTLNMVVATRQVLIPSLCEGQGQRGSNGCVKVHGTLLDALQQVSYALTLVLMSCHTQSGNITRGVECGHGGDGMDATGQSIEAQHQHLWTGLSERRLLVHSGTIGWRVCHVQELVHEVHVEVEDLSGAGQVARGTFEGTGAVVNICCTNEEDSCVGASVDGALAGGDAGLRFPELSAALLSTIKAVGNMR